MARELIIEDNKIVVRGEELFLGDVLITDVFELMAKESAKEAKCIADVFFPSISIEFRDMPIPMSTDDPEYKNIPKEVHELTLWVHLLPENVSDYYQSYLLTNHDEMFEGVLRRQATGCKERTIKSILEAFEAAPRTVSEYLDFSKFITATLNVTNQLKRARENQRK